MIKGRYTFTWISLGLLVTELLMVGICMYRAVLSVGSSGLWIGCLGILGLLLGLLGFRMAWADRELLGRGYRFPLVMMIMHGMFMIVLVAVYLLGLMH